MIAVIAIVVASLIAATAALVGLLFSAANHRPRTQQPHGHAPTEWVDLPHPSTTFWHHAA